MVAINQGTGFSISEIIRRATRFALPKFLSGEVDISKIIPAPLVDADRQQLAAKGAGSK